MARGGGPGTVRQPARFSLPCRTHGAGAAAYAGASHAAEQAKAAPEPAAELRPDQKEFEERGVRNRTERAIKRTAKSNGLKLIVIIADTFFLI